MPEPTADAARTILQQRPREDTAAKQDRFLIELLAGKPLGEAAAAAGVSRSTGLRWRKESDFSERFRQGRQELLEAAVSALQDGAQDCVATLRTIATDTEAKGSDRVLGARHLLDLMLRSLESVDLAQRIARLESATASEEEDTERPATPTQPPPPDWVSPEQRELMEAERAGAEEQK